jgi:hypothetical protein
MLATHSGRTRGVTCTTTLAPSVSYSHPNTIHSLRSTFSHRALTLRRSLAPHSCTPLAPLTPRSSPPTAPRSLLRLWAAPPTPSHSLRRSLGCAKAGAGDAGWWWCSRTPLALGVGGAHAPPLAAGSDPDG